MGRAPYGHDQRVYGTAWATRALTALLIAVFVGQLLWDRRAEPELEARIEAVLDLSAVHPTARVDAAVLEQMSSGASQRLAHLRRAPDAPPGPHDDELERAVTQMSAAGDSLSTRILGYRSGDPSIWSAITSAFAHADLLHLMANLLFLWAAGPVIECFWDRGLYLAGYALFGAVALAAHHLSRPDSLVPLVGASGAISGLLGAFVVGFPKTRVRLPWLEVPALAVVALWALFQVGMLALGVQEEVAHAAHLGGLVSGALMAIAVQRSGRAIGDAGDGAGGD